MEKVGIITLEQKDSLIGHEYRMGCYFNPIVDCNEDWIISQQEIEENVNPDFPWVNSLTLIDWCGPYVPISGTTGNYFDQYFSGNTGN